MDILQITYVLFGIGVGVATQQKNSGDSLVMKAFGVILLGLFWPMVIGYALTQTLHKLYWDE